MQNKYRKLHVEVEVEVEAVKWTGNNLEECMTFLGDCYNGYTADRHPFGRAVIRIKTLEGVTAADKGDYIVCGIKGEMHPCKPDIFEGSHIKVEE